MSRVHEGFAPRRSMQDFKGGIGHFPDTTVPRCHPKRENGLGRLFGFPGTPVVAWASVSKAQGRRRDARPWTAVGRGT